MGVKLLTEHNLEFLSLKEAVQARLSLHLSKCHIVGNHMSRLKYELLMLNLDMSCFENSVNPDQLVSMKQADQDPHCFFHSTCSLVNICLLITGILQVN